MPITFSYDLAPFYCPSEWGHTKHKPLLEYCTHIDSQHFTQIVDLNCKVNLSQNGYIYCKTINLRV